MPSSGAHHPFSSPPKEISEGLIPERPSRSRFRSFFSRKKGDKDAKENAHAETVPGGVLPPLPPIPHHESGAARGHQAPRSRSMTWSSRNIKASQKTAREPRPRALTAWDPPPLFQAVTQAVLQEVLDIPSTFTEAVFGNNSPPRGNNAGNHQTVAGKPSFARAGDTEITPDDHNDKYKSHWSGSSTISLTQKLFILVDRGYILQYNAEGHPDRLPEKIMELSPNSVAIASDALHGKHWVLRVSQDGKAEQLQTQTPKSPPWTRLPFRSTESKRLVKDFLLVFESAVAFDTWLTAIRKEIEALGGLEYRPDSREDGRETPKQKNTPRLRAHKSMGTFTQSSSNMSLNRLEQTKSSPTMRPLPPSPPLLPRIGNLSSRKSVGSSSTGTATNLDQLRAKSVSDGTSLRTANTNSFGSSTASASPATETFPAGLKPKIILTKSATSLAATRSFVRMPSAAETRQARQDARKSSSVDPSLLWAFQFPRTANAPTNTFQGFPQGPTTGTNGVDQPNSNSIIAEEPLIATVQQNETKILPRERNFSEPDLTFSRPVSVLAPLPEPGTSRMASSRYRRENGPPFGHSPSSSTERPTSSHSRSGSRDMAINTEAKNNLSYSLFPKRDSSLEYSKRLSPSPPPSPSSPATTVPALDAITTAPNAFPFPTAAGLAENATGTGPPRSGSRRKHRKTVGELQALERSPAVTEAHLASCFGTQVPVKPSVVAMTSLSTGSDITTTTIVLPSLPTEPQFLPPVLKLENPPKKERRISPQRSMPILTTNSGPPPPLGPPPSGPLPAVPSLSNSASSSPQTLKPSHGRGKSSVSSMASQSSLTVKSRVNPKHLRTTSSTSSSGSLNSTIMSLPVSPGQPKHARKLSSVSSVGSLGSVTGWMSVPPGFTIPPTPNNVPHLTPALSASPHPSPVTPTFPGSTIGVLQTAKPRRKTVTQDQIYRTHRNGITIVSPGTAF